MKTDLRAKRWAAEYPDLGTAPLPTEPYVSEEYFALERDRVFQRCWLNVGRVEEIPKAGDYFVREIAICRASVLVIRGADGVVRGFHNVCSHRSNRLVKGERGSCRGILNCRFHNWGYSDEGKLISVPDEENFYNFDKKDHGLTPVNTDLWEGFIFIHLGPDPAESLREYLGGVADRLDGCPFHEMKLFQAYRVEEQANWKVVLDAQNELYHLPHQHRWTLGNVFAKDELSGSRFRDLTLYGHHNSWSAEYGQSQKLTTLKVVLFLNRDDTPEFLIPQGFAGMEHFNLFPNTVLTLYQVGRSSSCITYNLWPIAVDRTVWEIRFYFREASSARERLQQEYFKCLIRETLEEDSAAHENVHAGVASRAKSHILLQDDESPIRHFRKVLEHHVGPSTQPATSSFMGSGALKWGQPNTREVFSRD